jgi:hypothetical protein
MQLSEDLKNLINTKAYKEIEAEILVSLDKIVALSAEDEQMPFTEQLMKEYAVNKAKEYAMRAIKNIRNLAKDEEPKKISWK